MSALKYWVWLSSLEGLGSRAAASLVRTFGGPMEAYYAAPEQLDAVPDLSVREREALANKDLSAANRILGECDRLNIRILTAQDADYPQRLSQIYDPPAVLYIRGRLPDMESVPVIGMVGTRKASPYAEKVSSTLAYQVTRGGGLIVTGLALGVDAAAARGALMAGGACVGVLGTAVNVDYPAANSELIDDVAAVGCVISEYPPDSRMADFPRRNRIISGLSCGVCVVEAPKRSGALITADYALEQGRDLFVVPGNVDNPNCAGSNLLLRDAARIVLSGEDLLSEYSGRYRMDEKAAVEENPYRVPAPREEAPAAKPFVDWEKKASDCTDVQISLLRILSDGEKQMDELIELSGLPAAKVLSEMTVLTVKRLVCSLPGKRYVLQE